MVQPMLDNFNQGKFSTDMATGDKQQQAISVKKSLLKDLPTENRNTILRSPVSYALLKDSGFVANTVNATGRKRKQPSSPSTPQPLGTKGTNGHLICMRRKLETEPEKLNNNNNIEPHVANEPKVPVCASNCSTVPIAVLDHPEPQRVLTLLPETQKPREHWKERYYKLQMFLRSCDNANHEKYSQTLRSMTPAGRSKHAYELEKRAILLAVEEAKQMHRATGNLKILGKASSDRNVNEKFIRNG